MHCFRMNLKGNTGQKSKVVFSVLEPATLYFLQAFVQIMIETECIKTVSDTHDVREMYNLSALEVTCFLCSR